MESTIRIERHADQGRCVGHIDGRVVFVRFALPGELVRVVLDEPHDREDRFWTGEVTEVLEASEDRVEPVWPLAGPLAMGGGVGGADLVHVSLPGQLKWKSTSIAEQMRRLGHVDVDVPIERMPEDEAEQGLHWRTRIEMIADENGRPSMRRRGTTCACRSTPCRWPVTRCLTWPRRNTCGMGDSLPDRRFVCLFPSLAAMPKSPTTTPCSSMAK